MMKQPLECIQDYTIKPRQAEGLERRKLELKGKKKKNRWSFFFFEPHFLASTESRQEDAEKQDRTWRRTKNNKIKNQNRISPLCSTSNPCFCRFVLRLRSLLWRSRSSFFFSSKTSGNGAFWICEGRSSSRSRSWPVSIHLDFAQELRSSGRTISPSRSTFSPRTRKIPRGMSAQRFPA